MNYYNTERCNILHDMFFVMKEIFLGADDKGTEVVRLLDRPIVARFVRTHPLSWNALQICMRIEVYGCSINGKTSFVFSYISVFQYIFLNPVYMILARRHRTVVEIRLMD